MTGDGNGDGKSAKNGDGGDGGDGDGVILT